MNNRQVIQKTKRFVKILQLVFVLVLLAQTVAYATGGTMSGSGTTADPFLVADYADLKVVGTTTTYSKGAVYQLIADIDASASATENSGSGFVPIGKLGNTFTGIFHGAGHVIKKLYINRSTTTYVGLFGYAQNATIDSLGMIDNNIIGQQYVGGIVGYNDAAKIAYCYNQGNVSGSSNCVGGITGMNFGGTVNSCYNTHRVSGSNYVGGIAGIAMGGNSVMYCYNTGDVSGASYVGGIGAYCQEPISNCYNTGSIYCSSSHAGGIAGREYSSSDIISNCYNAGSVSGSSSLGGIIGYNNISITTNCYWDTITSGQSSSYGTNDGTNTNVIGLSTAKMKNSSNLTNLDFASIWTIRTDSTYPGLKNLDNAPFAFADTFATNRTFTLSNLLLNDCDIETARLNLTLKIVSTSAGTTDSINTLIFPDTIANGTIATVKYRVGEIRTADTLWGNIATAIITLDTTVTAVESDTKSSLPNVFALHQNYPNPFNPSTTITFDLPKQSYILLVVYDMMGREITTLVNETLSAGNHSAVWNATRYASGVYFYRLTAGSLTETKMTCINQIILLEYIQP